MPQFVNQDGKIFDAHQWPKKAVPIPPSMLLWMADHGLALLDVQPPNFFVGHVDDLIKSLVKPGWWITVDEDGIVVTHSENVFDVHFSPLNTEED